MQKEDVTGFYKNLGNLVRAAREEAGLSQGQLASRIGLTRPSIANVEAGRQKILLHALYQIGDALGKHPKSLLPAWEPPQEFDLVRLSERASNMPEADRAFVMNTVGAAQKSGESR